MDRLEMDALLSAPVFAWAISSIGSERVSSLANLVVEPPLLGAAVAIIVLPTVFSRSFVSRHEARKSWVALSSAILFAVCFGMWFPELGEGPRSLL
jgi:hypothetical protein